MAIDNVEIKARCRDHARIRSLLKTRGARFAGTDHQVDTYFHVPHGRLKLRKGTIENALIHYHRPDDKGPKHSHVHLYRTPPGTPLKALLTAALGVRAVVDKQREICFVDNVKFHLDTVAGLGTFVEIEAIDADGTIGLERLHRQCETYLALFEIEENDLVEASYGEMVLRET